MKHTSTLILPVLAATLALLIGQNSAVDAGPAKSTGPNASDGTVAGDGKPESGGEKPKPEQAANLKPKVATKTAPEAKAAPKDAAIRQVRIELNLISIKNGEKVRSGI